MSIRSFSSDWPPATQTIGSRFYGEVLIHNLQTPTCSKCPWKHQTGRSRVTLPCQTCIFGLFKVINHYPGTLSSKIFCWTLLQPSASIFLAREVKIYPSVLVLRWSPPSPGMGTSSLWQMTRNSKIFTGAAEWIWWQSSADIQENVHMEPLPPKFTPKGRKAWQARL